MSRNMRGTLRDVVGDDHDAIQLGVVTIDGVDVNMAVYPLQQGEKSWYYPVKLAYPKSGTKILKSRPGRGNN